MHPDHFPLPILATSFSQLVQPYCSWTTFLHFRTKPLGKNDLRKCLDAIRCC